MSTQILAFDTATEACSAALMVGNTMISERFVVASREHTQRILPMIHHLLTEAGITLKNLDLLAFGRGPGSFTGVRIGISVAQGLALGADLPFTGISTLATLAQGAWRQTGASQVLTAIDARMGEIYWAQYRKINGIWLADDKEIVVTPAALTALTANLRGIWAIAGTGWQAYPTLVCANKVHQNLKQVLLPSAQDMLPLALHHWCNGSYCSISQQIEPTYLRNAFIWKNHITK